MSTASITPTVYSGIWTNAPRRPEVEQQAEQLIRGALCMDVRHSVEAEAPVDWEAGILLLESEQPEVRRLGTLFLLQALATTANTASETAGQLLYKLQSAS